MEYLIQNTTKEEREKIVADSLGNISASCDGCMAGLAEMYQDYIDGKKELKDINMEFNARYVSSMDSVNKSSGRKLGPLAGGLAYMADDFDQTPDCFKEYM